MAIQSEFSRLSGASLPQILLAAAPGLDAAAIAAILRSAGCGESSDNEGSTLKHGATLLRSYAQNDALYRAKAALAAQPDAILLVAYEAPVPTIGAAIAADVAPDQALEDWLTAAQEVLAIFRQARRRILLFDYSAALANPEALIEELNRRLGITLTHPELAVESAQASPASKADPVHLLIADRVCHYDRRARQLIAEIEASSLPLKAREDELVVDVVSSFQTYREKCRIAQKESKNLEKERNLVIEGLEDEKAANDRLRQENQDLKEENDLLLQQLHHVQEELERYFLDNSDIRNKFEEQEKQKIALTNEVQRLTDTEKALRNSLSWKITAPIRFFLRPLMGK